MQSLKNKVAIVTGSSRGIGAHLARELAKAGASVIVNYAGNKSAADQVVSEIQSEGGDAIVLRADISKVSEVKAMFDAAIAKFGKIRYSDQQCGRDRLQKNSGHHRRRF